MDEGWSASTTDVFHPNPDLDLQELIAYGRERNVQIVLWLTWLAVEKDMDRLFATLEEWGIPGVKIDFRPKTATRGFGNSASATPAVKRSIFPKYPDSFTSAR